MMRGLQAIPGFAEAGEQSIFHAGLDQPVADIPEGGMVLPVGEQLAVRAVGSPVRVRKAGRDWRRKSSKGDQRDDLVHWTSPFTARLESITDI